MPRTSLTINPEISKNIDILGEALEKQMDVTLSKGEIVKIAIKDKMQSLGLKYQKIKEVSA